MKNKSMKLIAVSLSFLFTLILTTIYSSDTCYAATGTMGTESPAVVFEFKDSDGKTADGNSLVAGTYSVDVKLSGMASVSIFQMSANYAEPITDITVSSTYNGNMKNAGPIIKNKELILGLYSTNVDTTAIDSNGTVLATLTVTVSSACDFANAFTVNTDPNYSFIQADYGDGYNLSYVPGATEPSGDSFPMTYDVSPTLPIQSFDIKGNVKVATSLDGDSLAGGIIGITVSVTDNTNTYQAVTDKDGNFTILGVPTGSYDVTISGTTTIDRKATLTVDRAKAVDGVINLEAIGIITCDTNHDTFIDGTDYASFTQIYETAYDVALDLNSDGFVDGTDYASFSALYEQKIEYSKVEW